VSQETGIPAAFMLAQAAHETGWGRAAMKTRDGQPAHNLFGIKATAGWTGKVAEVATTEYINGQPRRVMAKFRAYDSPEEPRSATTRSSSPAIRATLRRCRACSRARPARRRWRSASPATCRRPATPPTPSTPTSSGA
jgi:uncharacterized FlgJ-related protein